MNATTNSSLEKERQAKELWRNMDEESQANYGSYYDFMFAFSAGWVFSQEFMNKKMTVVSEEEELEEFEAAMAKRMGMITDGYGSYWSIICPMCHQNTMEVVRPGKVQCGRCG